MLDQNVEIVSVICVDLLHTHHAHFPTPLLATVTTVIRGSKFRALRVVRACVKPRQYMAARFDLLGLVSVVQYGALTLLQKLVAPKERGNTCRCLPAD